MDSARAPAFEKAKFKTALAVPIFSSGAVSPACVLCCYSLVRAEAVPTVLRFVQQALRLLWTGLDNVEPHQSIGKDRWKDVAPADLGEMAADVEMQQAFLRKKRPHNFISLSPVSAISCGNCLADTTCVVPPSHIPAFCLIGQVFSTNDSCSCYGSREKFVLVRTVAYN